MDELTVKEPSDTKITVIKTSSDILSEPSGGDSGSGPGSDLYTDESAPSGVSFQRSGEDQLKTSQQLRKEHKRLDSSY